MKVGAGAQHGKEVFSRAKSRKDFISFSGLFVSPPNLAPKVVLSLSLVEFF
jgi:hypothetical protein